MKIPVFRRALCGAVIASTIAFPAFAQDAAFPFLSDQGVTNNAAIIRQGLGIGTSLNVPSPDSLPSANATMIPPAVPQLSQGSTNAPTYYVSPTGSDSNTCTSLVSACATIQAAVNLATTPGSFVNILPGKVYGNLNYTSATVTLSGGGGTCSTLTPTIAGGIITAITASGCSGYTVNSTPSVAISGNGNGATATALATSATAVTITMTPPIVLSHSGSGPLSGPGGSCTSPITIQTYPFSHDRAVIAGYRNAAGIYGAIGNSGALSCIVINRLELAGWNGDITWGAVGTNLALGLSSLNAPLYNLNGIGFVGTQASTNLHHIVIANNYVHDFPLDGIGVTYGDFISVLNNHVENNGEYSGYEGSCISLYQGQDYTGIAVTSSQTRNVVSGNFASGCINMVPNMVSGGGSVVLTTNAAASAGSVMLPFASTAGVNSTMILLDGSGSGCLPPGEEVWYFTSTAIYLDQPLTCNIASGTKIAMGYMTDGHGIIIDNNSCSQTYGCSTPEVGRTLVENNITTNNGGAGIQAGPYSNHVDIAFNTSYLDQSATYESVSFNGTGPLYIAQTTDTNVMNNICVSSNTVIGYSDNSIATTYIKNNIFYGGYQGGPIGILQYPSNTYTPNFGGSLKSADTGNLFVNPQFVNPTTNYLTANFMLQSTSPALNAGTSAFTRAMDYASSVRASQSLPPSMGAYEPR